MKTVIKTTAGTLIMEKSREYNPTILGDFLTSIEVEIIEEKIYEVEEPVIISIKGVEEGQDYPRSVKIDVMVWLEDINAFAENILKQVECIRANNQHVIDTNMDWILFIFKRGFHHYLVCGESETDAWKQLCTRQSCRLEIAQKEYKLIKVMKGSQGVVKL